MQRRTDWKKTPESDRAPSNTRLGLKTAAAAVCSTSLRRRALAVLGRRIIRTRFPRPGTCCPAKPGQFVLYADVKDADV